MSEVLHKTRQILSDESRWTQGVTARNQRGNAVNATSEAAVQWCLIGAIGKAVQDVRHREPTWDDIGVEARKLNPHITKLHGWGAHTLTSINDSLGYEAVMELLDEALER